jgi:hypothetical protein
VTTPDHTSAGFLRHDQCVALCSQFGIPVLRVIFAGSMQECFKWSHNHNTDVSEIHQLHGLPAVEDNVREGNVIKPIIPMFKKNGTRVIYKDKNTKWCETAKSMKKDGIKKAYTEYAELLSEAVAYITQARLDAVCSKLIPGTALHLTLKELVMDAEKEFLLDHPDCSHMKEVRAVLFREAKKILGL